MDFWKKVLEKSKIWFLHSFQGWIFQKSIWLLNFYNNWPKFWTKILAVYSLNKGCPLLIVYFIWLVSPSFEGWAQISSASRTCGKCSWDKSDFKSNCTSTLLGFNIGINFLILICQVFKTLQIWSQLYPKYLFYDCLKDVNDFMSITIVSITIALLFLHY